MYTCTTEKATQVYAPTKEKKLEKQKIERYDFYITSGAYRLFVREIVPANPVSNDYVLFVHGLTFPSLVDFDLPVPDYSITEYLAGQGINCCIFDIRGYGKSDKPAYGKPVCMFERAQDVQTVYQFLKYSRSADNIGFVGLSSGCNAIMEFIAQNSVTPEFLVLMGPCYLKNKFFTAGIRNVRLAKTLYALVGKGKTSYVTFSKKILEKRLYKGEEGKIEKEVYDSFVDNAIDITCPGEKSLRAPIIPFLEHGSRFEKWEPFFNARNISCPVFVMRGDSDEICCERSAGALVNDLRNHNTDVQFASYRDRNHDMHLYKKHDDVFQALYIFIQSKRGAY